MGTPQVASFRRVTAGILASAALAMREDAPEVTKTEVARTLKRAAPLLGIKNTTFQVLDILLDLSRHDDWKPENRPVVAISNERLAHRTMASVRTVQRAIAVLVEAGILAYRDSPTGRRFIYRDNKETPTVAYGLDFSPARHRLEEFKQIIRDHDEGYAVRKAAERKSQATARAIVDALELMCRDGIDTAALADEFNRHMADFGERNDDPAFADQLGELLAYIQEIYAAAEPEKEETEIQPTVDDDVDMSCTHDTHVTPNTDTTPQHSVYKRRHRANARSVQSKPDAGCAGELALEKEPRASGNAAQVRQAPDDGNITIGLIQMAGRELMTALGTTISDWRSLTNQADKFCRAAGIPHETWIEGVRIAGLQKAAVALIIVGEKLLRGEDIKKPARYFLGMLYKAPAGELNLAPTLWALAKPKMN